MCLTLENIKGFELNLMSITNFYPKRTHICTELILKYTKAGFALKITPEHQRRQVHQCWPGRYFLQPPGAELRLKECQCLPLPRNKAADTTELRICTYGLARWQKVIQALHLRGKRLRIFRILARTSAFEETSQSHTDSRRY